MLLLCVATITAIHFYIFFANIRCQSMEKIAKEENPCWSASKMVDLLYIKIHCFNPYKKLILIGLHDSDIRNYLVDRARSFPLFDMGLGHFCQRNCFECRLLDSPYVLTRKAIRGFCLLLAASPWGREIERQASFFTLPKSGKNHYLSRGTTAKAATDGRNCHFLPLSFLFSQG